MKRRLTLLNVIVVLNKTLYFVQIVTKTRELDVLDVRIFTEKFGNFVYNQKTCFGKSFYCQTS